jgi:hypothetical protein
MRMLWEVLPLLLVGGIMAVVLKRAVSCYDINILNYI